MKKIIFFSLFTMILISCGERSNLNSSKFCFTQDHKEKCWDSSVRGLLKKSKTNRDGYTYLRFVFIRNNIAEIAFPSNKTGVFTEEISFSLTQGGISTHFDPTSSNKKMSIRISKNNKDIIQGTFIGNFLTNYFGNYKDEIISGNFAYEISK